MGNETKVLNILLIEDSDSDAFMIQKAINEHHKTSKCQRVNTFAKGEETIVKGGIDLVFLDLGLPDTESSWDTCEQMKKWFDKVPVVIMTGLQDHDLARLMVHDGVADFVSKDAIVQDPSHIKAVIDFAVERHAVSKKPRESNRDKEAVLGYFMGGYSVDNTKNIS